MKYIVKISLYAENEEEALKVGQLFQNISDNTDDETKAFLFKKVKKNPSYFRKITNKLKNPVIQKMLG